jgi:flagellar biosynthesis protein FlhB
MSLQRHGMSERQYAAHAGISRGAVQKARASGRLVLHADGSIDAAASDARRAQATDPAMQRGRQRSPLRPVPDAAVGAVAFAFFLTLLADLELLIGMGALQLTHCIGLIAVCITGSTLVVMSLIAAAHFMYQRHAFTEQMRMTRQEVRDEHKQSEGDPQIKGRIRNLRAERAQRQMMMAAVPKADVVITNPTHYAVALEYKMDAMMAPKVVAKGVDHLARRIREIAAEHDVPVTEDPPLARALHATVDLDGEVPPEH